jgi:hypothetical protein
MTINLKIGIIQLLTNVARFLFHISFWYSSFFYTYMSVKAKVKIGSTIIYTRPGEIRKILILGHLANTYRMLYSCENI